MSRRIDHYADPDAPPATELRPAVTLGVTNDRGEGRRRTSDPAMRRRLEHWLSKEDDPYLA